MTDSKKESDPAPSPFQVIDWNEAVSLVKLPSKTETRYLQKSGLPGCEGIDGGTWNESDRRRFLDLYVGDDS